MDHTIKAYIGRQSTEILEILLRQYTESDDKLMANTDTVLLILEELKNREGYSGEVSEEQVKQAKERFLKYYADGEESE